MNEDPHKSVTTLELTETVRQIRDQMIAQEKLMVQQGNLRHKSNGDIQKGFITIGLSAEQMSDRIRVLEHAVEGLEKGGEKIEKRISEVGEMVRPMVSIASEFRDLRSRLLGDQALQSTGLITQTASLERRLLAIEEVARDNRAQGEKTFREQRLAIVSGFLSLLGGLIGAVIWWIQHKP